MDTLKQLIDELDEEYKTTKKFLQLFPVGKNNYTPHEKSMKIITLTAHIVDIFRWPELMLTTSDLDLAVGQESPKIENKEQLLDQFDKNYNVGLAALENASELDLNPNWSISMNGNKLREWTKYGAIRHALYQITHHRAQLGVYYRLLDISLPGSYGPSADDQSF